MCALPELMEKVFGYLQMKDLLRIQRVCTKWRDLVQNSSALQRQLFFKPTKQPGIDAVYTIDKLWERDANLLEPGHSKDLWADHSSVTRYARGRIPLSTQQMCETGEFRSAVYALNPLLCSTSYLPLGSVSLFQASGMKMDRGLVSRIMDSSEKIASCHEMFLTQPPVPVVQVTLSWPPTMPGPDPKMQCNCLGIFWTASTVVTPCCNTRQCRFLVTAAAFGYEHSHVGSITKHCCPNCNSPLEWKDVKVHGMRTYRFLTTTRHEGIRLGDIFQAIRASRPELRRVLPDTCQLPPDGIELELLSTSERDELRFTAAAALPLDEWKQTMLKVTEQEKSTESQNSDAESENRRQEEGAMRHRRVVGIPNPWAAHHMQ